MTTLIILLIIGAVIITAVITIGFYVLLAFLIIGGVIGGGYSIFVYVKALVRSIKEASSSGSSASNPIIGAVKKWLEVFWLTVKYSMTDDWVVAKNAYNKSTYCKVLSFKKWMWLTVAAAVLICGTAILAAILILQLFLLFQLLVLAVALAFGYCILLLALCVGFTLYIAIRNLVVAGKSELCFSYFDFTRNADFGELADVAVEFWQQELRWIKESWKENLNSSSDFINQTYGRKFYSPISWFFMVSGIVIFAVGTVAIAVAALLSCIVFIPVYLVQAIWICINRLIIVVFHH